MLSLQETKGREQHLLLLNLCFFLENVRRVAGSAVDKTGMKENTGSLKTMQTEAMLV